MKEQEDWNKLSPREKIDRMGPFDITAVFDFLGEGSWNRDKAEKELHRLQMSNIDFVLDGLIAKLEGMKGNVPLEGNQALALNYNLALQDFISKIKEMKK